MIDRLGAKGAQTGPLANERTMLDRPGTSLNEETTVGDAKDVRGVGRVRARTEPATLPQLPEGSLHRSEAYHERRISSRGPNSMVALRAQSPKGTTGPASAFASLIEGAKGQTSKNPRLAANQLLDGLKDYLGGRTERLNRTGDACRMLREMPNDERIPLLRRAVHALRVAAKDGTLPPQSLDAVAQLSKMGQGLGWNFDWDDNIANMGTKLILFHQETGKEREVTTSEYAVIRDKVGKTGEWADWAVKADDQVDGSFRNFRDLGDAGVFSRDLDAAMQTPGWKGPAFEAFQTAMAHEATARWSTIITARGHFPNTIHAKLEALRDEGVIKHVLPEENIYPVSLPGLAERLGGGTTSSPSEAKIKVMEKYLDRLDAAPFGPSTRLVVPPDGGNEKQYLHLWGFSDDDHGTFKKSVETLGEEVRKGRWPNTKITLFFTGKNHPEVEPHAVVLKPDGEPRPRLPEESREVESILKKIQSYQNTMGS